MGIRFDGSTDRYSRTTNLPAANAFTFAGWFKIVTDRNNYTTFFAIHTTGFEEIELMTDADGTRLSLWVFSTFMNTGTQLTVGAWNHLAVTNDGADARGYLNGVLDITNTVNFTTTINQFQIGNSAYDEFLNGEIAAVKIYNAVLTAEEIRNEMRQYVPVRWANLNAWYPLRSTDDDQIDFSVHGRTLTVGGSPANAVGPLISWRVCWRRAATAAPGGKAAARSMYYRMMGMR